MKKTLFTTLFPSMIWIVRSRTMYFFFPKFFLEQHNLKTFKQLLVMNNASYFKKKCAAPWSKPMKLYYFLKYILNHVNLLKKP